MAHHGPSIAVLTTGWSFLRSCTYVHRNRTLVGASPPTVFSVRGAHRHICAFF